MRLLTFQLAGREAALKSGERYAVPWACVEPAWLPAYHWLAAALQEQSGAAVDVGVSSAPVWCWQRLAGDANAEDCARELFSEADLETGILMLELDVPPAMVLLSSYSAWNALLGEVIENGHVSPEGACRRMFDTIDTAVAVAVDEGDAVQAIIPFIEPEWILSVVRMDFPAIR